MQSTIESEVENIVKHTAINLSGTILQLVNIGMDFPNAYEVLREVWKVATDGQQVSQYFADELFLQGPFQSTLLLLGLDLPPFPNVRARARDRD